ncbi:unnamed protein product [Lepidochelys kempii]
MFQRLPRPASGPAGTSQSVGVFLCFCFARLRISPPTTGPSGGERSRAQRPSARLPAQGPGAPPPPLSRGRRCPERREAGPAGSTAAPTWGPLRSQPLQQGHLKEDARSSGGGDEGKASGFSRTSPLLALLFRSCAT